MTSESTKGTNSIVIPLNTNHGWDENSKSEFQSLVSKLTPDEVITSLKTIASLRTPNKNCAGRPKVYAEAWIKLQNNLITIEEFEIAVHRQLIDKEITKDTYYRAMRKARKFTQQLERNKKLSNLNNYKELWAAFHSNYINWEDFQTKLLELKNTDPPKISDEKYQHGIREGEKLMLLRKRLLEFSKPK